VARKKAKAPSTAINGICLPDLDKTSLWKIIPYLPIQSGRKTPRHDLYTCSGLHVCPQVEWVWKKNLTLLLSQPSH